MTRFINTTLIGLVAFVVILALLWLVVDPTAPGMSTQGTDVPTAMTVRNMKVAWSDTAPGEALDVEMVVRNQGAAGSVTQIAYRVALDGHPLAAATATPPIALAAGLDTPVRFSIPLPSDTGARWLEATRQGDTDVLRVDGSLAVRTAAADQRLPFEWSSSTASQLLGHLSAAPQECQGATTLCIKGLDAAFKPDGLQVRLQLRNDAGDPLTVRNGTFRLVFEDAGVAAGTLSRDVEVAPGEQAEVAVTLGFDDEALVQWWAGHVQRCETSRLSVSIHLETESVDAGPTAVDWEVLAAPLHTGLVCRGSAA